MIGGQEMTGRTVWACCPTLLRAHGRGIASSLLLLGTLACQSEPATSATSTSTGTSTGSSTTHESGDMPTSGGTSWFPGECPVDESPFLSADCLEALRSACGEHDVEGACAGEQPLSFLDDQYIVRCSWAKVVKFSDAAACTVASVTGRCEASVDTACSDACAGDFLNSSLTAIPSELEIIEMCGGPLGPWSAVGSEPGAYLGTCAPTVKPPAPPLCDCASVACAAE